MPGSIIAVEVLGLAAGSFEAIAVAFAINMVASSVVAKQLAPDMPNGSGSSPNPGSRQLVPPAGDNKLPVIYGSAYVGGIITDMTITSDNKNLYYAIALAEVTNTEYGGTPDTMTFGNIYYGGKLCQFSSTDPSQVVGLLDESTGLVDTTISGHLNIYCYPNGSNSASPSAISVMSASDLTYKWTSTNLMSNCAFAIVKLNYNSDAGVTSLQQTKFQITNSRYQTGDCFYDYLTSERYGAALLPSQVDSTSLAALTAYSNGSFSYTPSGGGFATQTRFRFDGVIDTNQDVMSNLQAMSACCDCLIKYNEIAGKWGVIVQQPTYTVAMDINDTNMISSLSVTPIDLASSYNICEVKFPDGTVKDSFNTATFDLAVVAPSLLYPNEPVNKQTLSLPLVNNNVRAQYLANRFLKSAREDLQLQVRIDFSGLQLEAGDVVTVTNANYGWTAKPFRITKVTESFSDDGTVTAALFLSEFNASVYDDVSVTSFARGEHRLEQPCNLWQCACACCEQCHQLRLSSIV